MSSPRNIWRRLRELYAARNEPEYLHPLAELAWRTLLILTAIAIVGVIFYAIAVFATVMTNLGGTGAAQAHPPVVLDRGALDEAIQKIQDRGGSSSVTPITPGSIVAPGK